MERSTDEVSPVDKERKPGQCTIASSKHAIRPALFAIVFSIGSFLAFSQLCKAALPKPKTYQPSDAMPFNLTNALHHIEQLGQTRRFVGTQSLESAFQYVLNNVLELQQTAEQNGLHLDVELFRSGPGSFFTAYRMTTLRHSYDNISSVVARVRPANLPHDTSAKALLINAHIDSAVSAPGVSDNVAAVGIALDIVRALVTSREHAADLQRPVIFLFNGAEEVLLYGAHSFVTQHAWGHSSTTYINLESIGSGRAYYLFRLGPHAPWLARAYADAVSYPYTSVAATDVFSLNIIPAETDYRIFDEVANIPGFDFALIENGYIYHTIYDDLEHLEHQGVLHGGITVFELTKHMAGKADAIGEHLKQPHADHEKTPAWITRMARVTKTVSGEKDRQVVFFDILRKVTIVYPESVGAVVNTLSLAMAMGFWGKKLAQASTEERYSYARMCMALVASIGAACLSTSFASLVYAEVIKAKLIWYGSMTKALIVFGPPLMFGVCSALLLTLPKRLAQRRYDHMLFAVTLFFTTILVALMRTGHMTSYIPSVAISAMTGIAAQSDTTSPLVRHAQLLTFMAVMCTDFLQNILSVMLPLLGRVRLERVPHDTVAALAVSFCCVIFLMLPTLPALCHYAVALRRVHNLAFALCVCVALWLLLVLPGHDDSGDGSGSTPYERAAPHRLSAVHFGADDMSPRNVLLLISHDANHAPTAHALRDVHGLRALREIPRFGILNATALEALGVATGSMQDVRVFETPRAPGLPMPEVRATRRARVGHGIWNVTLEVEASDTHLLTLRLDTREGAVHAWSFAAPLANADGWCRIKHHGSDCVRFWVVVGRGVDSEDALGDGGDEVSMVVSSARFGYSRSTDAQLLRFEEYESASVLVSVAREFRI